MNTSTLKTLIIIVVAVAGTLVVVHLVNKKNSSSPKEEGDGQSVVTVQAGTVETGTLHGYVQVYGEVEPDPGSAAAPAANLLITAQIPGVVKSVRCAEGQKIKAGEVLFEMDPSVADIAVKEAQVVLQFAQENSARQEKLLQIKAASEKTVQASREQLAAAQAALSKAEYERSLTTIRAAQSGTVIRVNTTQGTSVNPGDVLAEAWDLDRKVVLAQVPSGQFSALKIGQKAILSAGKGSTEEGTLTFIDDRVNASTGTVNIRILPAETSMLHCGQFVFARVIYTEHADCLTVPEESVVLSPAGESSVAVIAGDVASIVPVTIGLKELGRIEVSGAGIQAGMQVITAGAYGLPDQTHIRILAR